MTGAQENHRKSIHSLLLAATFGFSLSFLLFFLMAYLHVGVFLKGQVIPEGIELARQPTTSEQLNVTILAITSFWWWAAVMFVGTFITLSMWVFRD